MSNLRDQLGHARDAYRRKRYPGDLADDVFARLDAEAAAGPSSIVGGAGDGVSDLDDAPLRIGPGSVPHRGWWRPLMALAAAVAVVAATVLTLRYAGNERPTRDVAKDVQPPVTTTLDPTPPTIETTSEVADASDFTVVPTYQSFAISVPASISLASIEEYQQQAQERQN